MKAFYFALLGSIGLAPMSPARAQVNPPIGYVVYLQGQPGGARPKAVASIAGWDISILRNAERKCEKWKAEGEYRFCIVTEDLANAALALKSGHIIYFIGRNPVASELYFSEEQRIEVENKCATWKSKGDDRICFLQPG